MRDDEFFVGYLPVPRALKRFLISVALLVVIVLTTVAATIASYQRDPGQGQWHADGKSGITGILREFPYPMLETKDRTYLLVNEGKHGASVKGFDGRSVSVTGTLLERGPLSMIELTSTPTPAPIADWSLQRPVSSPHQVTLHGEIIDPKCFSGAMKPGDGRTHKACATLCIKGGIPPMFNDGTDLSLLTDEHGNALRGESLLQILPYIADPVQLTGRLEHRNGVRIIRLISLQRRTP